MTLRKITIDNSVRYVKKIAIHKVILKQTRKNNSLPKENKTKDFSGVTKPNTMKNDSLPRKQNKNISQNNKKFINNISAQGFKYLK